MALIFLLFVLVAFLSLIAGMMLGTATITNPRNRKSRTRRASGNSRRRYR